MILTNNGPSILHLANSTNRILWVIIVALLITTTLCQSSWQEVRNFHPYCIRQFRVCVDTSHNNGSGVNYNIAVGICGNKMAVCTFSNNLRWPWSTGADRPSPSSVDATSRLNTYRNALTTPNSMASPAWLDVTEFLPDCRAEFRRCVDSNYGGVNYDHTVGICGHGMSICTTRHGRWPYGTDNTFFWQTSYSSARLQIYRNAYSNGLAARNWLTLTTFLPRCRSLMNQCVPVLGGSSSNAAVGSCGNQMGICTFENAFWPLSNDNTAAYIDPYDARWNRYSTVINVTHWQNVTRFSLPCTDQFFSCVFSSGGRSSNSAVGTCGNRMSLCTFNDNVWPTSSTVATPFSTEPFDTRLALYRSMFEFMASNANSYSRWPPVPLPPPPPPPPPPSSPTNWLEVTSFSRYCRGNFFDCVHASGGRASDWAIGVCGHKMSYCTVNRDDWPWPNDYSTPFYTVSYISRLGIYYAVYDGMLF